ncbi:Cyclic di-GMP phosphodiesterase response regulator RpfG [Posidoniimonas polymericola]|uniref:Cyclic di-GMP phosphodiesterase response regulator RpfG n=1 Tax=Posidoniimonas polymericola TaxID=2528002 RepID=A0A5C5YFH1_9BACT|nr:HD domain-containing phosphohydrolase [Posidoniimonas polymericola]TWT73824.1 Cyclic di-GMP phosphodiesterase response regulator RpfG [Posidoniimonas polymericola]
MSTSSAPSSRLRSALPQPIPGFEPIESVVLARLGRWDLDLFIPGPKGGQPVLLRGAGVQVEGQRIETLVASLDGPVLVRSDDFQRLSSELLERLDELAGDESIPESDRFVMLQTAAAGEVEVAAGLINPTRFVGVSRQMGRAFNQLMQSGDLAPAEVYAIARHDHYTFSHITNVCCYALTLATALGIHDSADLEELAIGALLHDSGKRHIPVGVLRKKGRLTDQEWATIRQHPQRGFEDLANSGTLTLRQLLMIYQHHERIDGGGYPVGLVGAELHPWSRLLAVVDVFDALTGRRPYRRPCTTETALKHLQANAGKQFDAEMVDCWSTLMGGA